MDAPQKRRFYIDLHDLRRVALDDIAHHALGEDDRQVDLFGAQRAVQIPGALGEIAPGELDARLLEFFRVDGQLPGEVKVFGNAADGEFFHDMSSCKGRWSLYGIRRAPTFEMRFRSGLDNQQMIQ